MCCFLSGPPLPPGPHLSPGILPGVHSQVQGRVCGQAEVVRREYRGQHPSCWNSLPSSALCLPFRRPHVWFLTQTVGEHPDDSEVWLEETLGVCRLKHEGWSFGKDRDFGFFICSLLLTLKADPRGRNTATPETAVKDGSEGSLPATHHLAWQMRPARV